MPVPCESLEIRTLINKHLVDTAVDAMQIKNIHVVQYTNVVKFFTVYTF